MSPEPRYATPRDVSRPSLGGKVARIAEALGKPLMPWQRTVVDTALEVLPDGSWAYQTVVVTVQRQSGKTTLLVPTIVHRCLTKPTARTWLTAQTRQDARDTWMEAAQIVKASPLKRLVDVRESNGSEALRFGRATFRPFAPKEDALHGKANELVAADEVWHFDAEQGSELEQAIIPTFTTTGGQFWLVSTAGHQGSAWLRSYVDKGRAAVDAGGAGRIAYFEWAIPEDADPLDLDVILAFHPAAGHTLNLAALQQAHELLVDKPGEFARAFGNRWTTSLERVIPAGPWGDCQTPVVTPTRGQPIALAFDVPPQRDRASILTAWRDPDTGRPHVEVIQDRTGDRWLVDEVVRLASELGAVGVGYDAAGPALDIADRLRRDDRLRVPLEGLATKEYAAGCAAFLGLVLDERDDHRLAHHGQQPLDDAAAAAAKRYITPDRDKGPWVFSRNASGAPIAPLVAAVAALWTLDHATTRARAVILTGRKPAA